MNGSLPDPTAERAALRRARVLVVDDDALSQEVACGMLAELPIDLLLAGNGEQAVRHAAAGGLDLILMDVQMPVMDGLQAARAIRAVPGCANLPIIAMSANTFPEDRQRCRETGMNAHVSKPVDFDLLRAELSRWLPSDTQPLPSASPECVTQGASAAAPVAIDEAEGLRFFGGREDAYRRMLQRFATLRSGDAALLRAALAAGQMQEAGRIAHSLKSMAATLGARDLRVACAHAESIIAEADAAAIATAAQALEEALRAACADISGRLARNDGLS